MRFSDALNQYLFVIVIVLIAAAAGIFLISKSDAGQKFFKKRPLALSTAASRFANCMALALSSGLDTDQGLMLAEQLVDNPYMASRIKKCRDLTASGRGFAEAVLTSGIFSKIYTSMITIGFRTGSMDEVMHQISEEYEEETDSKVYLCIRANLSHYPVHFHRTHFNFLPSASHWHYVKYRLKVIGTARFFYDTIETKKEKKI